MKPSIFNKYLVRVHAGDNDSSQVNSRALAFQSLRIGAGSKSTRLQRDSRLGEKFQIGAVPDERKNEIIP